jgi:hypothetical protein
MSATDRRITAADIIPAAEFGAQRAERRKAMLPMKKLRRVEVGPHCTFYFETYETMLFQVQEMLLIEKGGEAQLKDELLAYNPLIPQGSELVATIMFEIDEPRRRAAILGRLGGVEERFFVQVGDTKIMGVPEGDTERTDEETGKASSVHFCRFAISDAQKKAFRDPGVVVMVGVDHEHYGHVAILSPATRRELAGDFS